jgi:hypothetical protein
MGEVADNETKSASVVAIALSKEVRTGFEAYP